ncbi:hypothetical protein [Paracoccus aerodenitrificans]|uniref:hypothetical protein n=1 Tax=Paracoccus aerodenitrificans TaxID=3017781 RepID=UPI0022F0FBA9|nr:hypothetical protein [Paracoccus aerodenitrificans]WBU63913.1 hypothetical protein PAE61_16535 [Paracoccus aerodenitrificans]
MANLTLSPPVATLIFVAACLAGYRYRRAWKEEAPSWQLWLFGLIAVTCLLAVGFIPLT